MKTVVLVFHPHWEQSRVNKALVKGLDSQIEVRNMYQLYPDFQIDVATEHRVLEAADRIVLQFPMYWYSSPALLKQWEDDVLSYGWAYGTGGTALHGKELMVAVSPGADNYGPEGFAKYSVRQLLRPFQATSRLIGTTYLKPFVTTGAASLTDSQLATQVQQYHNYVRNDDLVALGDFE